MPPTLCDTGAMSTAERPAAAQDMVWVEGGEFLMGSNAFYPEEPPVRRVTVGGFWMDPYPVTGSEFRRFVARPATPPG